MSGKYSPVFTLCNTPRSVSFQGNLPRRSDEADSSSQPAKVFLWKHFSGQELWLLSPPPTGYERMSWNEKGHPGSCSPSQPQQELLRPSLGPL